MIRPLLLLTLFGLMIVSACETTPSGPIYPPQTQIPTPIVLPTPPVITPVDTGPVAPTTPVVTYDSSLPETAQAKVLNAPLVKAAVILPLDHANARIKAEAEGIYNGIEMAVFDNADDNFVLMSVPTDGSADATRTAFAQALVQGAQVILGPLMSQNTTQASSAAAMRNVPVLAFTNDTNAARSGARLISLVTEEEVRHMVEYAIQNGVTGFGYFGPDSAYGRRVEAALRNQTALAGRSLVASEFYSPQVQIPSDAAERFVSQTKDYARSSPRKFAVLIPETGIKLRSVATLLPYFGLNERNTVFMGTRIWNDPSVWREPVLTGGVFPLADPDNVASWSNSFSRIFGKEPSRLASYGYDAGQLAIGMFANEMGATSFFQNAQGFMGVNGAYRFKGDRTLERNLAIMRITADGKSEIVSEATQGFQGNF